jgi:hypothetical protein
LASILNSASLRDEGIARGKITSHIRDAIDFSLNQAKAGPDVEAKLKLLLKEILELARKPSQEVFNQIPLKTNYRGVTEFFYSGCWFPKNPLLRKVPNYKACKNLKSMAKNHIVHQGSNVHTPGLFLVFCHEHDELIGFQLLKFYESTRTVHDLLLSRFPRAPSIVIYDHACHLHKYSISREPKFFADTTYYVDKLHYGNHTECSCAYDPFKPRHLDGVNTTIYEQVNSQIKHTRRSLQKMTQNHFLFIMRHILYMLKRIKVEKNLSWNEVLRNQTQPGKENNTVPDEVMELVAAHEGQAGSEEEEKLGRSVEEGGV